MELMQRLTICMCQLEPKPALLPNPISKKTSQTATWPAQSTPPWYFASTSWEVDILPPTHKNKHTTSIHSLTTQKCSAVVWESESVTNWLRGVGTRDVIASNIGGGVRWLFSQITTFGHEMYNFGHEMVAFGYEMYSFGWLLENGHWSTLYWIIKSLVLYDTMLNSQHFMSLKHWSKYVILCKSFHQLFISSRWFYV